MPEKVNGIVLDIFKFKESSVICKVFTLQHGSISIIVNGIGKIKSEINLIHLQPLSEIEFVAYLKGQKGVIKVKELNILNSTFGIKPNIKKYSISFFISEIVFRTFKEWEVDHDLYELLCYINSVIIDDNQNIQDIHLFFMNKYVNILGFSLGKYSDLQIIIDHDLQKYLIDLIGLDLYSPFCTNKKVRASLVNFYMNYLGRCIEMPTIKSLQILEEVLS